MKHRFAVALSFVLQLLVCASATEVFATSFVERPFEESVKGAPIMARGKIGAKFGRNALGNDGRSRIFTYYEFQVEEVFKGKGPEPGKQIMIRELGGEVGGVGLQIAGAASFTRGEDVIVMLSEPNPDESFSVRGLMTGKYAIEKDAKGEEYLVGAGVSSLTLPESGAHDETEHLIQSGHEKKSRQWSVSDLRSLIREQSGDAPARQPPQAKATELPVKQASAAPQLENRETQAARSAPGLQSEESGESSSGANLTLWGLGGLAMLLIFAAVALRGPRK